MGRLARWFLRILEMALLPVVQRLDLCARHSQESNLAVEAWGARTADGVNQAIIQTREVGHAIEVSGAALQVVMAASVAEQADRHKILWASQTLHAQSIEEAIAMLTLAVKDKGDQAIVGLAGIERIASAEHVATREMLGQVIIGLAFLPQLLDQTQTEIARQTALSGDHARTTQGTMAEIILAVRSQTEAMRAWEDALLGKVQVIADDLVAKHEGIAQLSQEQQNRALATIPFVSGLARTITQSQVDAALRIAHAIEHDARLAAISDPEHRAFQRAKLAALDLRANEKNLPLWKAKLLIELAAAHIQGRI